MLNYGLITTIISARQELYPQEFGSCQRGRRACVLWNMQYRLRRNGRPRQKGEPVEPSPERGPPVLKSLGEGGQLLDTETALTDSLW